jgi:hypothetical protein
MVREFCRFVLFSVPNVVLPMGTAALRYYSLYNHCIVSIYIFRYLTILPKSCKVEVDLSDCHRIADYSTSRITKLNNSTPASRMLSRKRQETPQTQVKPQKLHALQTHDGLTSALSTYAELLSEAEPAVIKSVREQTMSSFPTAASRMISSPSQGALLSFLATTINAQNILELGTFTGYSTLCLAMDFADFTSKTMNIEPQGVRTVYTCEINVPSAVMAQNAFNSCALGNNVRYYLHFVSTQFIQVSFG